MLVTILNALLKVLNAFLGFVLNLLPNSPFSNISYSDVGPALKYFTYFVPVSTMLAHFGYFLSILAVYYLYRVLMNWAKLLKG